MTSPAAQRIPGALPPLSPPQIPLDIWTLIFEELLDKYQFDYDAMALWTLMGATRLCKELQAEAERYLYRVVRLRVQLGWGVPLKFERFKKAVRSCPARRAGAIRDLSLIFWTPEQSAFGEDIPESESYAVAKEIYEFLNEDFEEEESGGEKNPIKLHALTIPLHLWHQAEEPDSPDESARPIRVLKSLRALTLNIGSSWKPWKLDHLSLYHATLTHLRLAASANPIPLCTIPLPVRKNLVSLIITVHGNYSLIRFWPGDLLKVDGGATQLVTIHDMPKLKYLELDESKYLGRRVHNMASGHESCMDFTWPMRCSNLKVLVWRTSPLHDGSVHDANLPGYEDRAEAFRRNHDKYIRGTFEHFPKLERLEHTKLPHELEDPDPYQIFKRGQPGGRILGLTPAWSRPDDSETAERLQAHADD